MTSVSLPPSLIRTLPGHLYADHDAFAREQERIFESMWFAVARSGELDAPGRFVTRDWEVHAGASDELLELLARNAGRVLTHRTILKAIWGPNSVNQPEHLWVLVAQLRKKLEPDPARPQIGRAHV